MKAKPIVSNYVKERKILVKKSILLISHSQKVTDGIKEMIEQMQKSEEVPIFSLGGINGEIGSDPMKIVEAVNESSDAASYFVFADIGSAVLNSELAKDMLEEEQQQRYHLVDAPLVEGAFAAAMPERKDGNKLKKIMNDPSNIVEEMLEGLVKSYPELVHRVESSRVVAKNQKAEQVGLVSGGGSGHEPSHAGFVGEGMLSAAVLGDVFTSPTPDQIQTAIKEADSGKGVLLIVKNYTGDALNFDMAKELAAMDDIEVESVIVDDDIAVENSTYTAGKRGVAGTVLVHKIVGDAARNGASLAELKELGEKVVQATKTIGLALRAATVPEVGKPGFELGEDEIEYGVGIHGEPGYRREKMQPSKVLAKELVTKILDDYSNLPKEAGVLVNGMGGTPLMEQFVFMNDVLALLEERGVNVVFRKVGNFMTSLDMQGLSLTLIDLTETQWKDSLESNVQTISW